MRTEILLVTCILTHAACSQPRDEATCKLVEKGFARAEQLLADDKAPKGEALRELRSTVLALDNDIHYCLKPGESRPKQQMLAGNFDARGEYERLRIMWQRAK
jgi:hypothetical protein